MRICVCDPPYLGTAHKFYAHQHEHADDYDVPATHVALLRDLIDNYDGWILATHTPGLRHYLSQTFLPSDCRTAVWVKSRMAGSRPNVRVGFSHEFVIFKQPDGRRGGLAHASRRDVLIAPTTQRVGVIGAKPREWTRWCLDLVGYLPAEDELVDMFPGSGLVQAEVDAYRPGCARCGRYLPATMRADARFCSVACRVAAHRRASAEREPQES